MSTDNCRNVLQIFFEDKSSDAWLYFMHNQAALSHDVITNIVSDNTTIIEVIAEIEKFKFKLKERMDNHYIPLNVCNQLRLLEENGWTKTALFNSSISNFY